MRTPSSDDEGCQYRYSTPVLRMMKDGVAVDHTVPWVKDLEFGTASGHMGREGVAIGHTAGIAADEPAPECRVPIEVIVLIEEGQGG